MRRRAPSVTVARPQPSSLERYSLVLLAGTVLFSALLHFAGGMATTSLATAFNLLVKEKPPEKVEMVIVERKPPPPPPPVEPPKPEPLKPPEPPKVVVKKLNLPPPPNAPPPPPQPVQAPPPPTQEAPTASNDPPMVIPGLTLSSTSTTGSFAVNVGNTLYGAPSQVAKKPEEVKPYKAAQYAPSYAITENPVDLNNLTEEQLRKLYPPEALKEELEGEVRARITIDDDGSVVKVVILEHPGHGFDEAARKLLLLKRFKPAKLNGQPVATEIVHTIHFELPN